MKRKTVGELIEELRRFPATDTVIVRDTLFHPEMPKVARLGIDIREDGLLGRVLFHKESTVQIVWGNWGESSSDGARR